MPGRKLVAALLTTTLLLTGAGRAAAQAKKVEEPLADKVRDAIDRGILFLKKAQSDRGNKTWNWENNELSLAFQGGFTTLTMLALLTAGVDPKDPVIQRSVDYLRSLRSTSTYVIALQTMALAELKDPRDLDLMQENVKKLLAYRVRVNGKLDGWSYGNNSLSQGDGSNTQYAMLGLYAAKKAGVTIEPKVWDEIKEFYEQAQRQEGVDQGFWTYYTREKGHDNRQTMTPAGISGLIIAGEQLDVSKQDFDPKTGIAKNCGVYDESEAIARGLRWMSVNGHFSFRSGMHSFYNIYGLERVGRLSGQRFIGDHDWYREGCEILVGQNPMFVDFAQRPDGSWGSPSGGVDGSKVLSTSFALLFLSKGRTPILISKLAFNARNGDENSWNNKRSDSRHLVEYSSRELFKNIPLAWQTFDCRKTNLPDKEVFDQELSALVQSPILYITGHKKPELTDKQIEILKRYIEEGGFVFGHACCGSKEFTNGFHELMAKIYPDSPLMPLRADHPVWTAHKVVKPNYFDPPLEGIERGCKTIVMFSPAPLAGYWEESKYDPANAAEAKNAVGLERGNMAYQLAGNIIAYATGLEAPQPRLTRKKILDVKDDKVIPRDSLQIGQLRHDGDWQPAPQAMRQLAAYLRDSAKLDISLRKDEVRMNSDAIFDHRFLYMHGRKKFTYDDEELRNVRGALTTGGVLFADACCGKKEFDTAFREFIAKVFPNERLQRISTEDFLFSESLNGAKIESVRCRTEKPDGSPNAEFETMPPFLEGIKINGRWVVIYSKYDIGCALEKHKSSACMGHDFDSALKIASAALLYSLKR
ncbi:DUF4159 domain-containing protein [Telmatocola sphagniphila]|uniref:DUF4159 domain-containing protein n=2 Tax=Telmatocola sphagniphila TaxID=1123043 RepID=A0A8E6EXA1_9BACT|nr:DUF4159 domain-containing protein [Telmatocola sphagniphila]